MTLGIFWKCQEVSEQSSKKTINVWDPDLGLQMSDFRISFNDSQIQLINDNMSQISKYKGLVNNGVLIISRGEIIDSEKFSILESLKLKFESQVWSNSNYNLITLG